MGPTLQFKTDKELARLSPDQLSVFQTLVSQDTAISLEQLSRNINDINVLRLKEMVEQRQANAVPRVSKSLAEITDNFTQSVCNTYRVEIKPLIIATSILEQTASVVTNASNS